MLATKPMEIDHADPTCLQKGQHISMAAASTQSIPVTLSNNLIASRFVRQALCQLSYKPVFFERLEKVISKAAVAGRMSERSVQDLRDSSCPLVSAHVVVKVEDPQLPCVLHQLLDSQAGVD
jgi:hypothetical protein